MNATERKAIAIAELDVVETLSHVLGRVLVQNW